MPAQTQDVKSEDGSAGMPDFGDTIDASTFEQILEMDDDEDDREFSRSIVFDFFTQAESTFHKMDVALKEGDLPNLSAMGHFLKGSSATLGLTKVKDSCEKIQHFGAGLDERGERPVADKAASLNSIARTLEQTKAEFREAEKVLRRFYHDDGAN